MTGLYLIGILAAAQIALIAAHSVGLLPRVSVVPRASIGGSNGRNNVFRVLIADDLNAADFAGVEAQERWESGFKAWLINALIIFIAKRKPRWWNKWLIDLCKPFWRKMELKGHSKEIKAHPKDKRDEILKREARALYQGYNGLFAHWKLADIEAELKTRIR